jgi:hypothetical protein
MKNQLPDPPPSNLNGPRAWGHRSRYFARDHATIEVAVYRVMLWGAVMYQRPATVYSLNFN